MIVRGTTAGGLRNLSYQKMQYFTNQNVGQVRKVLFENAGKNGMIEGYTDNYIKISVPHDEALVNKIVDWKV